MSIFKKLEWLLLSVFCIGLLSACGGGGGSSGGSTPEPEPEELTWDEGNWDEVDWQ